MSNDSAETKRMVYRHRRRRMVTGMNVLVAVALMTTAVVLLNLLVARFPWRVQLDTRTRQGLSERSLDLLKGMDRDVKVIAFLASDSALYDQVRALLREYDYAAAHGDGITLELEIVNPRRDIARTRKLARAYDVTREDVIVFACDERRKYVEIDNLAEYEVKLTESGIAKQMIGFMGEQAFSSAILSVTQTQTPVVYFATGHGERNIEDFSRQGGYSAIARRIRRDNIEVRRLQFAEHGAVPDDCDALVIAGPETAFADVEIQYLNDYLINRHGRVLFLMDAGETAGLGSLLRAWGVALEPGIVAGLTLSGHELVVSNYGDHPITRSFENVSTMFYRPRSVTALDTIPEGAPARGDADRARVSVLATTGADGWVEQDPDQQPPRFDADTDRPGPVSVSVAVEKGLLGVDAEIQPTRLVVVGGSRFVSNAAMKSGVGGNPSFFLSALNWLVEREALLAIAPHSPLELQLDMNRRQWTQLFLLTVGVVPGGIALIGFCVWLKRRR